MSELGKYIRETRKRLGITQVELAACAGMSVSYLNDIELNRRMTSVPSWVYMTKIGERLGVSSDYIAYLTGVLPDDVKNLDVTPERVQAAFAEMREVLEGKYDDR